MADLHGLAADTPRLEPYTADDPERLPVAASANPTQHLRVDHLPLLVDDRLHEDAPLDARPQCRGGIVGAIVQLLRIGAQVVEDVDALQGIQLAVDIGGGDAGLVQQRDGAGAGDLLQARAGVLEVDLVGGLEREVQVNVDLTALQGYNLTFDDVIATIQQENTNVPGGSIDVDRLNYLVRVDGKFGEPSEIEDLVVTAPGGQPVYVRDVADVDFGFQDRDSYARLRVLKEENGDGEIVPVSEVESQMLQVISLNVKKRSGDNILETAAEVREHLDAFPFPAGTQVTITGDQSEFVEAMVTDLENNIIAGLIFVVAVLLFFLGIFLPVAPLLGLGRRHRAEKGRHSGRVSISSGGERGGSSSRCS